VIYTYRNIEHFTKLNGTHCRFTIVTYFCPVMAHFQKFGCLILSWIIPTDLLALMRFWAITPQWVSVEIHTFVFTHQQNLTLRYGARSTGDTLCKNDLYDQLMHLIDIILDGQKCYLESIRGTEKFDILFQQYETERRAIIEPFCECVAVPLFPLLYVESSHWLCLVSTVTCYISSYSHSSPLVLCYRNSFVLT